MHFRLKNNFPKFVKHAKIALGKRVTTMSRPGKASTPQAPQSNCGGELILGEIIPTEPKIKKTEK